MLTSEVEKQNTGNKKREEKQLYGYFKRQTREIAHELIWFWLRKENLKREIESLFATAQNNAIKINRIKVKIDNMQQNNKYRLCEDRDKTINCISECRKLVQ